MIQQHPQPGIVAVQIVQDAGGFQVLERHLGHHLRDLFQCPGAAGERNESIPQLDHLRLALRHVLRDDQIGQAVVLQLPLHEELRLHAGHLAARCEDTVGQHPHQAAAEPP